MIGTADKLSMVMWAFSAFLALILFWIALSWYRKRRISLLGKAAILIVLAGMAVIIDACWIEPNWIKTEEVVIYDPALAEVLEGISVGNRGRIKLTNLFIKKRIYVRLFNLISLNRPLRSRRQARQEK